MIAETLEIYALIKALFAHYKKAYKSYQAHQENRTSFLCYDWQKLREFYKKEIPIDNKIPYREEVAFVGVHGYRNNLKISLSIDPEEFELASRPDYIHKFYQEAHNTMLASGKVSYDSDVCRLKQIVREGDEVRLVLQKAHYLQQAQSNLVMDWEADHALSKEGIKNLRAFLRHFKTDEPVLPPLDTPFLANSIGISAILYFRLKNGTYAPYMPLRSSSILRDQRKLAVFENGYHCSASGALELHTDKDVSFDDLILNDMFREIHEEIGLNRDDISVLKPVAICREFARGGKPQIFFAGVTKLDEEQLNERRAEAIRTIQNLKDPREKIEVSKHGYLHHTHSYSSFLRKLRSFRETPEAKANLHYAKMFIESYKPPVKRKRTTRKPAAVDKTQETA